MKLGKLSISQCAQKCNESFLEANNNHSCVVFAYDGGVEVSQAIEYWERSLGGSSKNPCKIFTFNDKKDEYGFKPQPMANLSLSKTHLYCIKGIHARSTQTGISCF